MKSAARRTSKQGCKEKATSQFKNEPKESKDPIVKGMCKICGEEFALNSCNFGDTCDVCDPPVKKFDSGRGGKREGAGRKSVCEFGIFLWG